jgi:hypothetical protein
MAQVGKVTMVLKCLSRENFIYTVNTKLFSFANHLQPGS